MTDAAIFVSGIMLRTLIGEVGKMAFKQFLSSSERRMSIFNHYLEQARDHGHASEWIDCHEGSCGTV